MTAVDDTPDLAVAPSAPIVPANLIHTARRGGSSVVDHHGRRVHRVFALPIAHATRLHVSRLHAHPTRPQALRLAAAVDLEVNGHRAPEMVLWTATAPAATDVIVHAIDPTVIYVWNMWIVDGIEHAWLGESGMLVDTDLTGAEPVVRLWCRDAPGSDAFDDLVVALTLHDI